MASFSIWHMLLLILIGLSCIAGFLPMLIKPAGPNRFGPSALPQTFPSAIAVCLRKYVDGNGRAKRSEYWWFYLATFVASILLAVADRIAGDTGLITLLTWGYTLPLIVAGVRRLHDINRSGWWLLLSFTGFGVIALIILLAWPSQKDDATEVF